METSELVKDETVVDYAFEILQGYPLYASTDGITAEEAVELALVLHPDAGQWHEIVEG